MTIGRASQTLSRAEALKRAAAVAAVELVENDSIVGLGTGSTARYMIEEIGSRLANGRLRQVSGVPTSRSTAELAQAAGIPLVELPAEGVALAIDGMDEVDEGLRAIKGLGGALAREKIVAASAREFVLIGDRSKRVERLAVRTPVPVEVLPFGWLRSARLLESLGLEPVIRRKGSEEFRSDNGNLIIDCRVADSSDLEGLAHSISCTPGVVEHGLFLEHANRAFIATVDRVEELLAAR